MSHTWHNNKKLGLFQRLKAGVCFHLFPRTSLNAVFDILEHISGIGCTIDKKSFGDPNWRIIVDQGAEIEGFTGVKVVVTGIDTTTNSSAGTTTIWLTTETWTYDAGLLKAVKPGQGIELFKFKVCE